MSDALHVGSNQHQSQISYKYWKMEEWKETRTSNSTRDNVWVLHTSTFTVMVPAYMLLHCDPELWPSDLCPIVHHWCKFGETTINIFQDIVVNKPRKYCFKHTLFHDLDLWSFDPKLQSLHLCPIMHHWCMFGENMSNTLQEITR